MQVCVNGCEIMTNLIFVYPNPLTCSEEELVKILGMIHQNYFIDF